MHVSVVIPVYNERDTVERVIAAVEAVPIGKEIVLVDDGSTDGSREILERYRGRPGIVLCFHERNQGKGAAIRTGFAASSKDLVLIQDADLEYDPREIPLLMQPIVEGKADVVYGSRFAGGGPHRVLYFWHSLGNRFLTLLSNMFTDLNLTDMETCYKLMRREVVKSFTIEEPRFGMEPEITAKIARGGWRIYEVGISYSGRTYAEGKKIGWRDGVRAIWCILKYNLRPGR